MSELLVNTIINADNNGPPNFPFGATGINTATSSEYADVAGIATVAEGLTGTPDITVGNIVAVDGTFSGDVSVAGTVSYEDVTEVNAVGIITAQSGIDVTGRDINITSGGVNAAGVITATEYDGYLFLDNQLF